VGNEDGRSIDLVNAELNGPPPRPADDQPEFTTPTSDAPAAPEAVTICLADVEPQPINWLWPNRIAMGKLTMLCGDPGLGKSFLALDLGARVTQGAPWPDNRDTYAPQGGVVILTAEDDLADTVRPRLDAAGADPAQVVAIQAVRWHDDGGKYERFFDLERDLPALEGAIGRQGNTKLVIIDPITAYLGKIKANDNSEVRRVLGPLADLCGRLGVACIGVSHLRKGDGQALYRTLGSLAFVAAARAVYVVARDVTDPEGKRRLMLPTKNNLGNDRSGLAFELCPRHGAFGQPCISWEAGTVDTSADEALAPAPGKRGPKPEERNEAAEFLRQALADGPRLGKEVAEDAKHGFGISPKTLERARKELMVVAYREKIPGPWFWKLNSNNANNNATGP
jgi:hypothetical protein